MNNFWVNKKVLVTGGCGFIGREVVKQLLEKDYYVIVVDDFSNSTPLEESNSLKVINFDLTKSEEILKYFDNVNYCIHLAAKVGGVKYMNKFQSEILKDDILIDINTITAANLTNAKIVYGSSSIVYDQSRDYPYKEEQTILIPKSDYGFSKLVGERLCQVFGKEKNLKFTIARIFNVYGINPNTISAQRLHVIPDLIRKIIYSKRGVKLYGGGVQKRTFIHVSDLASALITMMENPKADGEIFNSASEEQFQILDLAKMIWKLLGRKDRFYVESVPAVGADLMESYADVSKINKLLKWKAKKTLKKSLPEIVRWYQKEYETKVF